MTLKHRIGGRADGDRSCSPLGHRDCRRARCGARAGHRPSRHQAGEHLRHQARARQDSGLRAGEGDAAAPASGRRDASTQTTVTLRRAPDQSGHDAGDGRLHVAGAGAREGAGRAHRPVFLRRGAVRDGDGHAAVSRRKLGRDLQCDSGRGACCPGASESRSSSRIGTIISKAWKKIATCAISTPPTCAPICNG